MHIIVRPPVETRINAFVTHLYGCAQRLQTMELVEHGDDRRPLLSLLFWVR
jgi:hypothetical protein